MADDVHKIKKSTLVAHEGDEYCVEDAIETHCTRDRLPESIKFTHKGTNSLIHNQTRNVMRHTIKLY